LRAPLETCKSLLYGAVPVEHMNRIEELLVFFEVVHSCTSSSVSKRRYSFACANLLWHVVKAVRHRCSNALMHAWRVSKRRYSFACAY